MARRPCAAHPNKCRSRAVSVSDGTRHLCSAWRGRALRRSSAGRPLCRSPRSQRRARGVGPAAGRTAAGRAARQSPRRTGAAAAALPGGDTHTVKRTAAAAGLDSRRACRTAGAHRGRAAPARPAGRARTRVGRPGRYRADGRRRDSAGFGHRRSGGGAGAVSDGGGLPHRAADPLHRQGSRSVAQHALQPAQHPGWPRSGPGVDAARVHRPAACCDAGAAAGWCGRRAGAARGISCAARGAARSRWSQRGGRGGPCAEHRRSFAPVRAVMQMDIARG